MSSRKKKHGLDALTEGSLPGEKLATMEEFEGSNGTYTVGGSVRSLVLGMARVDKKSRLITVDPVKKPAFPSKGDSIIGVVEAAQPSLVAIRIEMVNGKVVATFFTGLIILPKGGGRGRRRIVIGKLGDIVRATVVSNQNAIIQLGIQSKEDGVLRTYCTACGSQVSRAGGGIRCELCGMPDDRELSSDFGEYR